MIIKILSFVVVESPAPKFYKFKSIVVVVCIEFVFRLSEAVNVDAGVTILNNAWFIYSY